MIGEAYRSTCPLSSALYLLEESAPPPCGGATGGCGWTGAGGWRLRGSAL